MYLRYRPKLCIKSDPPQKKTPQVELYKQIKRQQKRYNKAC